MRGNRSDTVRRRACTRIFTPGRVGTDRKRLSTRVSGHDKTGRPGRTISALGCKSQGERERGGVTRHARGSTRLDTDNLATLRDVVVRETQTGIVVLAVLLEYFFFLLFILSMARAKCDPGNGGKRVNWRTRETQQDGTNAVDNDRVKVKT